MYVCVCVCVYICLEWSMYVCVCICIGVCVYIYVISDLLLKCYYSCLVLMSLIMNEMVLTI